MITKLELANEALELAGLVSASNPATPEMQNKAVKALERSVLSLGRDGVYLGYNKSVDMFSPDYSQDSGISDVFVDDVIKYISVDICEALAAPFTAELKQMQNKARQNLMPLTVPSIAQRHNMPAGAGNRRGLTFGYNDKFLSDKDYIDVTDDGDLDITI